MTPDVLFELYKVYRGEMFEAFRLHRESLEHYLAFAIAILAATIAGVTQLRDSGWLQGVVLVGPVLDIMVCLLGIRMCNRYYLGVLERIAVLAKLEEVLALNKAWEPKEVSLDQHSLFPEDKFLLPKRWIKGSFQHPNSETFIESHMKAGVNSLARRTFHIVMILNAIVFIALLIYVLWR